MTINPFSAGTDRRQILTFKVDPRTERIANLAYNGRRPKTLL